MTNANKRNLMNDSIVANVAIEVLAMNREPMDAYRAGIKLLAEKIPCVKEVLVCKELAKNRKGPLCAHWREARQYAIQCKEAKDDQVRALDWQVWDGRRLGELTLSDLLELVEKEERLAEGWLYMRDLANRMLEIRKMARSKKKRK